MCDEIVPAAKKFQLQFREKIGTDPVAIPPVRPNAHLCSQTHSSQTIQPAYAGEKFRLNPVKPMKTIKRILAVLVLSATAMASARAQGYVSFANDNTTRISTNAVVDGAASGFVTTSCHYALYVSTTATSVGGQTAAIVGTNNPNYAFTDGSWTRVAYGTNFFSAGRFISANADGSGRTAVPGVSGGSTANFVVIGWSDSIGTDIAAVQTWYNGGTPVSTGWIGQSSVSGAVTLGTTTAATLFATNNAALIKGFVLGRVSGGGGGNVAPSISVQPANKTVTNGQSASFSVTYAGTPTPTFQWFCNSTNIPGQTGATLTVSNVSLGDSGNSYFVTLTNVAGSVTSSNAVLTVTSGPANVAPFITVQPANKTVTNGQSATFSVTYGGTPAPTFQWFCNGTNIPGKTSATLTVSNVSLSDSGNSYFVSLTNVAGSVTSSNGVLTVVAGPGNVAPFITTQPTNKSAVFGGSVTFTLGYGGNPAPAFQWQFNGNNIPGATSPSLILNNLTYSNAGTYSVTLTNIAGSVTSSNATLTVTTPPATITFANTSASVTKTFTNSAVGGAATGLTLATNFAYRYALYVSTNATAVNGQTAAILGADSTNYAFADVNWAFVAYGTNNGPGRLTSLSADNFGKTAVTYASGQSTARFVVLGWSSGIGTDIASLSTWFNGGSPSSDGWIGQSSVSGAVPLGGILFSTNAPYLQGFTLGLVSGTVNGHITYTLPPAPPLMVQATMTGQNIQLTWPLSAGTYGVQSASSPAGPWSDAGLTITSDDVNASATTPATGDQQYFRLIQQ